MKITIILKGKTSPGKQEELRSIVRELQQEFVLQEDGCEQYEFYIDGDCLIMLERWASQAALDLHTQTKHFSEFVPKMRDCVEGGVFSVQIIKSSDLSFATL